MVLDSLREPAVVTRSSEDDAEDRGHVMCGSDARYAGSLQKPGTAGKAGPREPCGHATLTAVFINVRRSKQ